jgi:LmbE family N-acetylglucosaminyl deacetylase
VGGTNVSLGQQRCQGGASASAIRLIQMGDRHDSVVASNEETGSIGSTDQVGKFNTRRKAAGRFGCALDAPAPIFLDTNLG